MPEPRPIRFTPASRVTGKLKTGPLTLPTTAGYQPGVEVYHVWETLDHLAEIHLLAADHVMTVKIEKAGGMNLDYFFVHQTSLRETIYGGPDRWSERYLGAMAGHA